jgi:hypothetical protein
MTRNLILPVLALAAAFAATSCSNLPSGGSASLAAYNAYDRPAKLPSNRSAVRVKVSLRNQMAYVLEGSQPLLVMPVAIGTPGTPTPQGSFRIFNKTHRHRANTHGYAYNGSQATKTYLAKKPAGWSFKGTPMPYWCEFKPNYGFHTGWMKPYPCTHGCIRMHHNVAPKFYQIVSNGTPVNIASTQPEDATLGRNVPRPPDSNPLPDFAPSFYIGDDAYSYHKPVKFD